MRQPCASACTCAKPVLASPAGRVPSGSRPALLGLWHDWSPQSHCRCCQLPGCSLWLCLSSCHSHLLLQSLCPILWQRQHQPAYLQAVTLVLRCFLEMTIVFCTACDLHCLPFELYSALPAICTACHLSCILHCLRSALLVI